MATSAEDFLFEKYWKDPTDENVEKFLSISTWTWLMNQEVEAFTTDPYFTEEEINRKLTHLENIRSRVDEDGYYSSANATSNQIQTPTATDIPQSIVEKLAIAARMLVKRGYPATFIILLNECWKAVDNMKEMMITGDHTKSDDENTTEMNR